ncbi:MAG: quinone-dependent dihydroorotate dehydrogenase [Chitinophagaceae bacterium]|nr:MAG: dihydroorotate dehydrogenase 2 [Bacteroidetes bacterium OLB11]MCC6447656.1 quinone-dependent dihydroorotate dehydrogenase [Chitinophagaceae bacterium]HMN32517.1 quinone-dependent dihydroorotate dehydrogenase [Chitinophagaceae bacterium]
MYNLVKKILFKYDPEEVHYKVMKWLTKAYNLGIGKKYLESNYCYRHTSLEKEVFGIKFKNPVGLAAGFDKDAKFIDELSCLGFGFIEIGTLTPRPQGGNDKPRLFRFPTDAALINRMGFNNEGVDAAVPRLKERNSNIIVGGNIGKNKSTPNENAIDDYAYCFRKLFDVVDYFVINVSSPNTPNLRELQEKEPLKLLLTQIQNINLAYPKPKPILLKIAPDLNEPQLDDIIEIVKDTKLSGIVATNTTLDREGISDKQLIERVGAGGLSGKPLKDRNTEIVKYIHNKTKGTLPIIAVGGIFTTEDAQEKLNAGASLVQVYTGFVYQGPTIVKKICKGLVN